jgi:hypothetical protein
VVPAREIARFRNSGFVVSTSVHAVNDPLVNGFRSQHHPVSGNFNTPDEPAQSKSGAIHSGTKDAMHGEAGAGPHRRAPHTWPKGWDYLVLGPVFDSISKPGYTARQFDSIPPNAIGIGGIQPANAGKVKQMGFRGAALLGAIWQEPSLAVEVFIQAKGSWKD